MFSGIRSLLFTVYPDQEADQEESRAKDGNEAAAVGVAAALQSIEQLQSSSHQILPTLEEQQEEDELKRSKQLEASSSSGCEAAKDEEDDGCFNADSWELLDLVEPEKQQLKEPQQEPANKAPEPEKQDDTFEEEKELELATPPTLNYAAALAKRLGNQTTDESKIEAEDEDEAEAEAEKKKKKNKGEGKKAEVGRALKRNRPVSSSSWSSNDHDELEPEKTLQEVANRPDSGVAKSGPVVNRANVDNDDNDSIISSGFSDCDFGYGAVNDFVMRPKKATTQANGRRRRASHSSHSLASVASSSTKDQEASSSKQVVEVGKRHHKAQGSQQDNNNSNKRSTNQQASSWKHIKPKKKKIILSAPSGTCSDFLKKRNATAAAHPTATSNTNATSKLELPAVSSSRSSTNSSELADMDDSWYVTPPPCFTRANSHLQQQPKAILSNRENALIEHPSIYIASTCKQASQQQQQQQQQKPKQQKFVNKQESSNWTKQEQQKPKQKSPSSPQQKQVVAKKAWENKFIVSNWGYEIEQDDINDFDNFFDDEPEAPQSKQPSAKRSVKKQKQKKVDQFVADVSGADDDDDCGSDWSLSHSPALVGITPLESADKLAASELVELSPSPEVELDGYKDEEEENTSVSVAEVAVVEAKKKAPVQVRPIGPERQPGWQLRRKRQRRRPLSTVSLQATNLVARSPVAPRLLQRQSQLKEAAKGRSSSTSPTATAAAASGSSANSSARMSPTLMDRIQSSIVANLTNLTGFQAIARQAIEETQQQQQQLDRQAQQQTLAKKLQVSESNSAAILERRRLTKSHLERQNRSVQVASSARRADRRLKMHTKPNGYSVNRKVQTAFH